MHHQPINTVAFIAARSKEIEAMEKSLAVSHKTSLAWQRLPHYRRRRNRNYDKRTHRNFSHRQKDRHALRSHTFSAKRFFMLRLSALPASPCIPFARRLKGTKFIYKSQARGFFFDESFRGVNRYALADVVPLCSPEPRKEGSIEGASSEQQAWNQSGNPQHTTEPSIEGEHNLETQPTGTADCPISAIDLKADKIVQYINNTYEAIVDRDTLILIGTSLPLPTTGQEECTISILLKKDLVYKNSETHKRFSGEHPLETQKIICKRSQVMEIFQSLGNAGLIPIGYEDIQRLALENNCRSIYDEVRSPLYAAIENAANAEIVAKYSRTPPAKRQAYDTDRLWLANEPVGRYFLFSVEKGTAERAAEIFHGDRIVGRVVRAAYKLSSGRCQGLGFSYPEEAALSEGNPDLVVKNLAQSNCYPIKILNFI